MAEKPCGCWTDKDGYWQLSPECLEEEQQRWRDAMLTARRLGMIRQGKIRPRFRTVQGKLRLIEDVPLPPDEG